MSLMDFIQQPDVLRFLFALLTVFSTIATAYAYRAKKSADSATLHAETVKLEMQTAKTDAEGRRDILKSIEIMAQAMSDNAQNDREERELRRQQIEQQNTAMMQIANNMSVFMQENVQGRAQAANAVIGAVDTGFTNQKEVLEAQFDNLGQWLDAMTDLQNEVRELLNKQGEDVGTIKQKVVELTQVADNPPPVTSTTPETEATPTPDITPGSNGEPKVA